MSAEEYWQQIIYACFLDEEDPIARWREVGRDVFVFFDNDVNARAPLDAIALINILDRSTYDAAHEAPSCRFA